MKKYTLSALVCGLLLSWSNLAIASDTVHNWEFLVAHKPRNTEHVKLIQKFADRVKEKTAGKVNIQLKFSDYGVDRTLRKAVEMVYTNQVQMSQIPVNRFIQVSTELDVLDMPMLFRDHAHAHNVLDSEIGKSLRDTVALGSNMNIQGLSFTYSGGWRNVYSTKSIDSVADLANMKMRTRNGRLGNDAMDGLNLDLFVNNDWREFRSMHLNQKVALAEEAETNRILSYHKAAPDLVKEIKTVLETNHSLYLTMISVNGDSLKKLNEKQRAILQAEANLLAQEERTLSIDQAAEGKKRLQKLGIKFIQITEKDRFALEKMAAKIYKKYKKTHGDWIRKIKAVDSPALAQKK